MEINTIRNLKLNEEFIIGHGCGWVIDFRLRFVIVYATSCDDLQEMLNIHVKVTPLNYVQMLTSSIFRG